MSSSCLPACLPRSSCHACNCKQTSDKARWGAGEEEIWRRAESGDGKTAAANWLQVSFSWLDRDQQTAPHICSVDGLFEITIFCSIYVFFFLLSVSAAHRHSPALERSVVTILYVFQALLAAEDGRRWLLFSDNTPTMSLATSVYITYENATVVEQLNDT